MSEKEYIEKELVMDTIDELKLRALPKALLFDHLKKVIEVFSTENIAPVKRAKNLATQFGETICTNCGVHLGEVLRIVREYNGDDAVYYYQPKYCANCGAKFDEGEWAERSNEGSKDNE